MERTSQIVLHLSERGPQYQHWTNRFLLKVGRVSNPNNRAGHELPIHGRQELDVIERKDDFPSRSDTSPHPFQESVRSYTNFNFPRDALNCFDMDGLARIDT